MLSSFTRKEECNNSIQTLFDMQNWEIEIRFFFMLCAQRTLSNVNLMLEELNNVEPVWIMRRPEPLPIIMSSELEYGAWKDRLLRSAVSWWVAPVSSSHFGVLGVVLAAKWARGYHDVGEVVAGALGLVVGWVGTKRKVVQFLEVCPCVQQLWIQDKGVRKIEHSD